MWFLRGIYEFLKTSQSSNMWLWTRAWEKPHSTDTASNGSRNVRGLEFIFRKIQPLSAYPNGWKFVFQRAAWLPKPSAILQPRLKQWTLLTTLLFSAETSVECFINPGRSIQWVFVNPVPMVYHGKDCSQTFLAITDHKSRVQVQHVHVMHAKQYQMKAYGDLHNAVMDKIHIWQWQYCCRVLTGTKAENSCHLLQHLKRRKKCSWSTCTQMFKSTVELRVHFDQVHRISAYKPCPRKFCFYCAKWYPTENMWNDHWLHHLKTLPLSSPLKLFRSAVVSPMVGIFGLRGSGKKPRHIFRPFDDQDQWHQHIRNNHLDKQPTETSIIQCPHPGCNNVDLEGRHLFWAHIYEVHGVISEITSCKSAINTRKRPLLANDKEQAAIMTTSDHDSQLSSPFEEFSATLIKQWDNEAAAEVYKVPQEESNDREAICEMEVWDWKEINIPSGLGLQLAQFVHSEI